ncbi:hypothetical protein [Azospirillum sp.]|uniref:hypothetical protein n=1 Tax=Azospirillum sp. TaxID=34012 RepID=UPI002603F259|nr:hypothetical protein [Azospirillum sp.]
MTDQTAQNSQDIRSAIAKAQNDLNTLAPVIADLQAEQRKLAALATLGMLTAAKADRQREVGEEIAAMKARQDELATGIDAAGEFLDKALETERVAKAKADWDEAEALLIQARGVAVAVQKALEESGARFAELEGLLEEAASLAKPHMEPVSSRSQLDAGGLFLCDLIGLVLKDAGGPDFDREVPYVPRPGRAPSVESVVNRHIRNFLAWRDRR